MKVLVLCDDYWHPAHVPRQGLGALPVNPFTFEWIENAKDWSSEIMKTYPLVILTKSNNISSQDQTPWMTESIEAAFLEYVRQGHGLLAIHSGTAEYDQTRMLRKLLGGVFHHHPEQCAVQVVPRAGHLLCRNIDPFTVRDEHYFMEMDDMHADIFVTTQSEHGEQPGAWCRNEGSGRVAVLTPGHNLEVWLHASFQALLLNSLRWCGKLL